MKLHTSIPVLVVIVTILIALVPAAATAQCTCPPAEPPVTILPAPVQPPVIDRLYLPYLEVQP
jgi:hypothetical protein